MCGQQPEGDAKAPTMKILVTRLATCEMNFLTVSYLFVRFSYPLQFAVIPGPSGCSCGTGSFAVWIETWVADDDLHEREGYKKSGNKWEERESWGKGMSLSGSSEDAVRGDERGGNSRKKILPEWISHSTPWQSQECHCIAVPGLGGWDSHGPQWSEEVSCHYFCVTLL